MRKLYLMLHHSATPDGVVNDWDAILRFHISWRYQGRIITSAEARKLIDSGAKGVLAPWKNIGYHLGVEREKGILRLRVGRDLRSNGAHCAEANMNRDAIGFCFVGNYDLVAPDPEMLQFAAHQLAPVLRDMKIVPGVDTVFPHRKYATYKSCPGALFPVTEFIAMLRAAM